MAGVPTGVGGAPVRALSADHFAAWVETVSDRTVAPTVEHVRAHDAVTEAALATGATPLPVRFGQTFDSDDACREALCAVEARLRADLSRMQGLVEMRVLAALRAPASPSPVPESVGPGASYMHRLVRDRSAEQIVQASAASVRERLSIAAKAFIRDEAFVVTMSPSPRLTLSHLIARDDALQYKAALAGVDTLPGVERLVVCGPVAPYQFVSPPA